MKADLYPMSTTVHVGVECPFCLSEDKDPCETTGGNTFAKECHAQRTKRFKELGIEPTVKPRERKVPGFDPEPTTDDAGIKLALWYLRKAGSIDNSRRFLEVAIVAMKKAKSLKS